MKDCSKITSVIKIATMKNLGDFRFDGKPSCATTKLTLFAVSKDEWDTKEEGIGKSIRNTLYVMRYAKGTSQAKATSNSENIKPVT